MGQVDVIRRAIREFCLEFVNYPYLCYTEHGLHALFYGQLFSNFSEKNRYIKWKGQRICVIQKEYPTAGKLDKPQRQHWDISVIKRPPESIKPRMPSSYDYLKLAAVVEFGMNEGKEHLIDDIERVCHFEANTERGFVVHLYRISEAGANFSGRDISPNSTKLLSLEDIFEIVSGNSVEVYYGKYDGTDENNSGVWLISQEKIIQIM